MTDWKADFDALVQETMTFCEEQSCRTAHAAHHCRTEPDAAGKSEHLRARRDPTARRQLASLDAISKADAAISRWVIAAGLKLIVVPVDSTWMRRSLSSGSRVRASHASRARAGRSRQRQSKWADSTCRCTRTALVTAPFLFRSGCCRSSGRRENASTA